MINETDTCLVQSGESEENEDEVLTCPVCSSPTMYGFETTMGNAIICIEYPKCNYIKKIDTHLILDD